MATFHEFDRLAVWGFLTSGRYARCEPGRTLLAEGTPSTACYLTINGAVEKVIVRGGAGLDTIDHEYARSKGITVMNTPLANGLSVAELALGYMFMLARSLYKATATMKAEKHPCEQKADRGQRDEQYREADTDRRNRGGGTIR